MNETTLRMTTPGVPPDLPQAAAWMGVKAKGFWTSLTDAIAHRYPGVFAPEWVYGGNKHGWGLRYKKGKSFCTLIPERSRCLAVIVFGAKERAKADALGPKLSPRTRAVYDAAQTYHDGKWVLIAVGNARTLQDVLLLLEAKRMPRRTS